MKYLLIIIISYNAYAIQLSNHTINYIFTYTSHNLSLGPFSHRVFTVHVKNNRIQGIDLANAEAVSHAELPYIEIISDAIKHKSTKYNISYDSEGFPKEISSKKSSNHLLGNSFKLNILSHQKVDESYTLDGDKLRIEYLENNYKKWVDTYPSTYKFTYQDSNLNKNYIDGLEITVHNNKIILLKDIFTFENIPLEQKKNILTIDQWFNLVKKEVKNQKKINIIYNTHYSFPYLMIDKDKKRRIYLHSFKIINEREK